MSLEFHCINEGRFHCTTADLEMLGECMEGSSLCQQGGVCLLEAFI